MFVTNEEYFLDICLRSIERVSADPKLFEIVKLVISKLDLEGIEVEAETKRSKYQSRFVLFDTRNLNTEVENIQSVFDKIKRFQL